LSARSKAFLGISIAGQHLASRPFIHAFRALRARFDELTFVIFDRLHIYNRAARRPADGLAQLLTDIRQGPSYAEDRRRWIARITPRVPLLRNSGVIRIFNVDQVADRRCYMALRNLFLLYECDAAFRAGIGDWVNQYLARAAPAVTPSRLASTFSTAYVLEEIAINLRLRVLRRIESEYYPGVFPEPLVGLYRSRYSATVYDILEVRQTAAHFRFFEYGGRATEEWRER
jgi:hypothetical protein